jgi:hypothetical protein
MEKIIPIEARHNIVQSGIFAETEAIISNGSETQLRLTLNNDHSGIVEVQFHELYEVPFRYPLEDVR